MSPLYILTDAGRLARFAPDRAFVLRMEPFGLHPVGLQSHDAKNAAIGKPRGDVAASDDGIGTQHSGTPTKHPHLRAS